MARSRPQTIQLSSYTAGMKCRYCDCVKQRYDEGWVYLYTLGGEYLDACPLHQANLEVEVAYGI